MTRWLKRLTFGGAMFIAGCAYTGLGLGLGHGVLERIFLLGRTAVGH